ncbi:unnamed protein product [Rotaria sp. Silwood1]|nr:unnamed protein product [Rotaria sp. Silwood1]CAF5021539.1 unnamed protein product [Rotaria sp. Silwood1]
MDNMYNYDYQFRLIVVGDSTVGKSSLLRSFCDGVFSQDPDPTVGVDFNVRIIEVKPGIKVKLQLWDTAGQERFKSITRAYYRNSVGVLLIYDTTNYVSFTHVTSWLNEARTQIQPYQCVFLLVGTKIDRESERQVSLLNKISRPIVLRQDIYLFLTHWKVFLRSCAFSEDTFRKFSSR